MNKVTSYLKNVGKSISYATVDTVTKNMIPEVSEFTKTNSELFKGIYATVSHSKQSINYAKKLTKSSQIYKDINTGINNVFSDIKTGNFYNKERQEAAIESAGEALAGGFDEDWGDFSFDDFDDDDGSLDDFQDKSPSIDTGDMVIADSVTKSSNLSAQLISKTVASTSSNIIKSNIATTNMAMAQNVELVAGIRTSISGVHESINSLLKFAQNNVPTQINNQSQYFTDSMAVMKENNAILKEMLEMQRNVYDQQLKEFKSRDQFGDVFSGGFDITEYFKAVTKNIKGLDKTGSVSSMLSEMGGKTMLGQMMSNPLGMIMTSIMQQYIPKELAKNVRSFSKTLENIFPTVIAKLNKWRDDDKGGIFTILGEIFGLKTETKKSIDTSKYNKKAVPFDGITRKSIIEVIPGYLSKIESILSGSSQRLFDYDSGKWITAKEIEKKRDDEYEKYVKDGFSEISDDIKRYVSQLEKQNALDAKTKKSLEADIYKFMKKTVEDGSYFSPEDLKKNSFKYGFDNTDLMESLGEALSKLPLSKIMATTANITSNKRRLGEKMAERESSGHSIYQQSYNNSNLDSHLKFHEKYKDKVIGNTAGSNLLNIKDTYGMTVHKYLNQILANLSYMREYGMPGSDEVSDRRFRRNRKSKSFDEYSKQFSKPYISKDIQKLDKQAKDRDEYYDSRNYNKDVNIDDAVLAAIYDVQSKGKHSDLDEDEFKNYGKRYKETNKWQKEMASMPGDTFLEKWQQARSMKEKQVLLMGSLSDIAKKPAILLSGMITSAESSIYNFLFKAESDDFDDEGRKIKGFFPAVLHKMRASWDLLTTSIDEKFITPLVKKYGLDEKWEDLKNKVKNSKPGQTVKNAKDNITGALKNNMNKIYGFAKNSVSEVVEPIIYNRTFRNVHERNISKMSNLINNNNDKMIDTLDDMDDSNRKWVQYNLSGTQNAEIIRARFKRIKSDLESDNIDSAKKQLGLLSNRQLKYIKNKLATENPELLEKIKNLGFSKGIVAKIKKSGFLPPYPVSKGETFAVIPNKERQQRRDSEEEANNVIRLLSNSIDSNENLDASISVKRDKIKAHENDDGIFASVIEGTAQEIKNIGKVISDFIGINGDTPEEQEADAKKQKNKLLSKTADIFREMKGEGADTVAKSIIGGGLGLLSGIMGGPIIGASLGAAYSLAKNSTTVNRFLFGEETTDEEGNVIQKDGIISKKIQDTFKKYIPDMGKFGVVGGIASLVLPFGPLAGAAIGAGIGLAKNSETMQEILFGEEGLINEDRKEKIKKYLPKAAIGAAAGMFLGPFGLLGNSAIGAAVGLLTGTEDFRDLIFGEKDANGDRIGGVKGALEEHFIEPIKNFGKNFKEDFFGFIKESMIDPLNEAITPITNEIAFQTKRVVFGIPKWFLNLGKDYIAMPLLRKLEDTVISPIAKGIKGLFSGMMSKFKGLVSLPFRAIGKVGEQTRKHQIRQGRDVSGLAKDRLKFAKDKEMGSYKYEKFDTTLKEKAEAGDTEWLEELTARTGMLAHGSDHFDKEIKKARKELSNVVSDYYKLGWFASRDDKKSYKRIKQYIHDNDIESAIEELTNIKESRTTGGPLNSEASDAIARFNRANKKYQVARDNKDKFGDLKDNDEFMKKHFGDDWENLDTKRLFEYARKESAAAGGKKVSKNDLFKDPRQLITKGEEEINNTLNKIYKLISGDKYTFQDEEKDAEYDEKAKIGTAKAESKINENIINIKNKLNSNGYNFAEASPILDDLYSNPEVYNLVLAASEEGINYDHETIMKLCKMKLSKKEIKLLKRFPYVATLPENQIKKNLNHHRNDYATLFTTRKVRNDNLAIDNLAGKLNQELDESTLKHGNEVDKDDNDKYMYQNTDHGLRRYIKDQKGKWTLDISDSDTKQSLQKENEEESKKNSFFNSFSGIKDGVLGLFNRDKEKDKEEKKEPWYKKLFNVDLGGFGAKLKFGAAIAGGFTLLGAISKLWENRTEGGVVDRIGTAVGKVVNPVISKIGNWFFNEGEYAAPDKGLSGFLDNHVFPNLFNGMNVFFGTVLPAVVTAFIKNIPAVIKGALKGVSQLFGWTDEDHSHDADAQLSKFKTSSGKSIKTEGSGNSYLSKLLSISTATANNINSIDANEDGTTTSSTNNSLLQINTNKNNNTSSSPVSLSNILPGFSESKNNLDNSNTSNETVSYDGIGVIYKKDENGELTPITEKEFASGEITEFYNESGEGHWVYNQDAQTFEADAKTHNKLPGIVAYAAAKSTLTGRTPGFIRRGSKILKGVDKVLSKAPIGKNAYKLFSTPVKAAGKTFGAVTKTGAYINKSFNRAMNSAKNVTEVAGDKTRNTLYGNIKKKSKDAGAKTVNALYGNAKKKSKDVVEDVVEGAAKNADKTYKSGLLGRAVKFIRSRLSKILNNSTVLKKISAALAESGSKKSVTKVVKNLIDKFMDIISKKLMKKSPKVLIKILSGAATAGVLTAAFIVGDFISGVDKAESILGISEPTILQELIAGLVNVISNEVFFGFISSATLVNWTVDWIFPIFNIDASEFKEERAKEEEKTKEYNLENGTSLSTEERLYEQKSIKGKVGSFFKKPKEKIKKAGNWIKDKAVKGAEWYNNTSVGKFTAKTTENIKDGISGITSAVKEKATKAFDFAKYAATVAKDVFADAINGEDVKTEGVELDKNDPNYETKKMIYYITKIALFLPGKIVGLGATINKKVISPVINGIKTVGSGIGNNIKNIFTKSWDGHFIQAMTDPGVETGHTASNIISNTITGIIKPIIAPLGLLTTGVGAVARNVGSIIDGFKTIGSSVVSSVSDRFKNAWQGNLSEVFKNNNPNTGNKLVDITAKMINGIMTIGTAVPALGTAAIGKGVRAVESVISAIKSISQTSADTKILKKANKGDVKIWSSEYWKLNGSTDGISGKLYAFNAYLHKVLNLPSALLGLINPANWDIGGGVKKLAKWLGIKDEYKSDDDDSGSGSGTTVRRRKRKLSGKGVMDNDDTGFVSQIDPKYANKKFNTSKDTERQTLGDSGCAPATAANVINLYSGSGNQFQNAANAALAYKDKNSGVTPEYFDNYLGRNGINTYSTINKKELATSIKAGNPTILLGHDTTGEGKTPYGPASSHYVLATGLDSKGNVIVQDPESKQPNALYPAKDVLNHSQLGMVTSRSSGRGNNIRTKRKFAQIKNKVNSNFIAGTGKSTAEIEKLVWSKLRGAGFSEIQVAGVMGNIKHESGFDPSVVEKGSGVGFGLCQWSYGRRTQIENYAKSLGKSANDVNVQIEFLIAEMTPGGGANGYAKYQFSQSPTYEGRTYPANTFKNAKDIETATKGFCYCWERPGIPRIEARINSAKEYYKKYTGTAASSSSSDSDSESTSSGLFSKFSKAVLSYYDEKLLGLLGFNDNSSSESDSDSSDGYNGSVSGKASDIVKVAAGEIGNGGTKYWKYAGFGSRVEWCACFVYWVCCNAGCKDAYGTVGFTVDIPMKYWINKGREVSKTEGQPGDFVSFHNGTSSPYCHIGLIEKNLGNGKYTTIEGNVGGGAGVVKRLNRSSSEIGKIVRPAYSSGKGSGDLYNKTRKYIDNSNYKKKMNLVAGRGSVVVKNTGPGSKAAEKINREMRRNILNSTNLSGISSDNKSNKTASTKVGSLLTGSGKGTNNSYKLGTLSTYNNYRKSLSVSGKGSGYSLPALSTSGSTVSGYYSNGSMPSYNNMNTGSSISIGNSSTEKLLSVIIDVLSIIANNSEKLSQIVELLSKALDLNLSDNDISNLSSNNAQIKNKIANALKSQGSATGMGNSIMNADTESLATAMYSIASA